MKYFIWIFSATSQQKTKKQVLIVPNIDYKALVFLRRCRVGNNPSLVFCLADKPQGYFL